MSYVPGQIVDGQIYTDQGFVDLPKLGPGMSYGSFSGLKPIRGFPGMMSNPLQPLSGALNSLAMKDSSETNQQRVDNTMSGIVSLINQEFPTFQNMYGTQMPTYGGNPGFGGGPVPGFGGGIVSFGVPDPINDPINYPDNPANAGTFDPSDAMKMLGQLTGAGQTPIQATNVSSPLSGLGLKSSGIGSMLGSLM